MESSHPSPTIAFSAREAIQLWRSNFWKASEQSLEQGKTDLPQVAIAGLFDSPPSGRDIEYAQPGPLTADDLKKVREEDLLFVMQAFLCAEGKRLYIAAEPEKVAILIWALASSLPRT